MKLAVVLFGEVVSPHFGSSTKILLVHYEGDAVHERGVWDVGGPTAMELARRLVEIGVDMLVCGGIQRPCKEWLTSKGVTVVENQKGPADDLVMKLIQGEKKIEKSSTRYSKQEKSYVGKK